jgi:hypothetical protein
MSVLVCMKGCCRVNSSSHEQNTEKKIYQFVQINASHCIPERHNHISACFSTCQRLPAGANLTFAGFFVHRSEGHRTQIGLRKTVRQYSLVVVAFCFIFPSGINSFVEGINDCPDHFFLGSDLIEHITVVHHRLGHLALVAIALKSNTRCVRHTLMHLCLTYVYIHNSYIHQSHPNTSTRSFKFRLISSH